MPKVIAESNAEDATLDILSDLGYKIIHGLAIAYDKKSSTYLFLNQKKENKNYARYKDQPFSA